MTRTLLVIAGGTGGHIYPGLAVADFARGRGWNVVWMGNPDGMEARIVAQRAIEMLPVRFSGLRGKGLLRALMLPVNLLRAFWQSFAAIGRARPSVVLGMGGYITFPGAMMGVLRGLPLAIHEQNSVAGLANRVLVHVADRVLTGFPDVLPKGEWVGNPVRSAICALEEPARRYAGRCGPLRLLVVGGSLGAKALNDTLPDALARIDRDSRPRVVHQSGTQHIEALRAAYREAGVEAELVAFIDDMAARYAQADVIVCRAGAITVAEIAAAGVASVLVPFPHAVDDHQTANARFLAEAGAALLLPQKELTAASLAQILAGLTRERLREMAEKARALAKPDAARAVADACAALAPA